MKFRRFAQVLFALSSSVAAVSAANAQQLHLAFTGTQFGEPGSNGAPALFNLHHGSTVIGSFDLNLGAAPINPENAMAHMYTNTIFSAALQDLSEPVAKNSYTYFNLIPTMGILQFYVNAVDGNLSDVFSVNVYATANSFSFDSVDFEAIGKSNPAYGDWNFQRYDYSTKQLSNYHGDLKSVAFLNATAVPEPASLALMGWGLVFAAARRRSVASGRRA